jgi:hypothetical protein
MKSLKSLALMGVCSLTVAAFAGNNGPSNPSNTYQRVEDIGFERYEAKISYPTLTESSVKGFAKINYNIRQRLVEFGCGFTEQEVNEDEFLKDRSFYYEGYAEVNDLNNQFVSVRVNASDYCGGAHPNHGESHLLYNASTGSEVKMDEEIPMQDKPWDNPNHEQYKKELATLIYNSIKDSGAEFACPELGETKQEIMEGLAFDWPSIVGVTKNKKVLISTFPSHAGYVCKETVAVDYNKVKKHIKADSILHTWLR